MDYSFTKTVEDGEQGYALALSRRGHPIASAVASLNEKGEMLTVAIKGVWSSGTFAMAATGSKEEKTFCPPFTSEAALKQYLIARFRKWIDALDLYERVNASSDDDA